MPEQTLQKRYKFLSLRYRSGTRIFKSSGEVPTWALEGFGGLYLVVCPNVRFVIVCMGEQGVSKYSRYFEWETNLFRVDNEDSTMIPSRFCPRRN